MTGATQCIISVGHAVQVQWHESEDGSIKISIRSVTGSAGGIQRLRACDSSSWTYSEQSKGDSNTITFENPSQNADVSHDSMFDEQVRAIQKKIEGGWDKTVRTLEQNTEFWTRPADFLGISGFSSNEELSYRSLENSRHKLHRYQNPFHKINLTCLVEDRFQSAILANPSFLETNCRKQLIQTLHRGYEKLSTQDRNTICKRFSSHIAQGESLRTLSKVNAGLLMTVAAILSSKDIEFLSKELDKKVPVSKLLDSKTLEESEKHENVASKILEYLRTPKRKNYECSEQPLSKRRQNHFETAERCADIPCEQHEPGSMGDVTNEPSAKSGRLLIQQSNAYLLSQSSGPKGFSHSRPAAQEYMVVSEQPVDYRDHDCAGSPQRLGYTMDHITVYPQQEGVGFDVNTLPSVCISELDLGNDCMLSDLSLLGTYTL